jgi:hypothetical protein
MSQAAHHRTSGLGLTHLNNAGVESIPLNFGFFIGPVVQRVETGAVPRSQAGSYEGGGVATSAWLARLARW